MWKSCFWHGLLVSAQNLSSEWVISSHGPGTRSEPSDKSPLMNRRRSHGGEATCHWQENNVLSGRNLAVANINHFEMTNVGNAMWHVNQYVAYEGAMNNWTVRIYVKGSCYAVDSWLCWRNQIHQPVKWDNTKDRKTIQMWVHYDRALELNCGKCSNDRSHVVGEWPCGHCLWVFKLPRPQDISCQPPNW